MRKEQLSIRLKSNFPASTSYQLKCWYLDARTAEVFFSSRFETSFHSRYITHILDFTPVMVTGFKIALVSKRLQWDT